MSKIHFHKILSGLPTRYRVTSCGRGFVDNITDNVNEVTCKKCLKTDDCKFARQKLFERKQRGRK